MYVCTKCQTQKTLDEMSKDASRRDGISSWCKECRSISTRKWNIKNPNRPTRIRALTYETQRNYMLQHRYGISLDDYKKLLEEQNNSCAICKRPANNTTYHFHVDHDHTTGEVRGLLCSPCNVYLGYIKDNPNTYQNGIQYLNEKSKPRTRERSDG